MSRRNIKDLTPGSSVTEYFLVKSKRLSTTKSGSFYLDLELQDRTGLVKAKIWEDAERLDGEFSRGDVVKIKAEVEQYREQLQLKIERLRRAEADEADLSLLLPSTAKDVPAMLADLRARVEAVRNPHLKGLLLAFFADEAFVAQLQTSAAARNIHHSYRGGLLEHIHAMVRIAAFVAAEIYPDLDADLVLAGALLHDIGKIAELDSAREISYTRDGYLQGHINLGLKLVQAKVAGLPDFPPDLLLHLEHIILSHHGEREWGSPVLPATPEAILIHHVDNLDAKTTLVREAIARDANQGEEFTEYHKVLERHLYKVRPPRPAD